MNYLSRQGHHKLKMIVLLFGFLPFSLFADPAPFGLIINKTLIQELKDKFAVQALGINKGSGLQAFDIEPKNLNFEGLLSAKAAFSPEGILKLVEISLPQTKFAEIYTSLNNKYKLIYKNTPFGGNKEAKFEQDNTYILLYAAQGSEEMDLLYINKRLLEEAINPKVASNETAKSINQL